MNELLLHNAEEKLKAGMASENPGNPATLIQKKVAEALMDFCRQEPKIAEAIIQSDKPFSECCAEIGKAAEKERYISDFEAYARAVKFYLPEAEIECHMTVKAEGGADTKLTLFDLLE